MGQEQSNFVREHLPSVASSTGVTYVRGSGSSVRSKRNESRTEVKELARRASQFALPHQLLPPPPVRDDMTSALQGAQMIHDLRTALGGFFSGLDESIGARSVDNASKDDPESTDRSNDSDAIASLKDEKKVDEIVGTLERRASSIDEFSFEQHRDTRAEQERWARLGIDFEALDAVIEQCTGGKPMSNVLDKQTELLVLIELVKEKSVQLRETLEKNREEARRTTRALDRLDRIHVALSDVQDTLESAVATANILGASHFAHDEEMCSFKSFLKHNPPRVP